MEAPRRCQVLPEGMSLAPVEEVGKGVTTVRVGDRVVANVASRGYADYVVADTSTLLPIPLDLDAAQATALSQGQVALHVLQMGRLQPGESVLIHAAAGGVGHLAVQLARTMGAGLVIATASSAHKRTFTLSLGADLAIDYGDTHWPEEIRTATGGKGVDVILESVGGDVFHRSLELLAPFGRLVAFGSASSAQSAVLPVLDLFGLKSVIGFSFGLFGTLRPDLLAQGRHQLLEDVSHGMVRLVVHARLPLPQASKAHALLEAREQLGKIVLIP